jgi:hypothetical protein
VIRGKDVQGRGLHVLIRGKDVQGRGLHVLFLHLLVDVQGRDREKCIQTVLKSLKSGNGQLGPWGFRDGEALCNKRTLCEGFSLEPQAHLLMNLGDLVFSFVYDEWREPRQGPQQSTS